MAQKHRLAKHFWRANLSAKHSDEENSMTKTSPLHRLIKGILLATFSIIGLSLWMNGVFAGLTNEAPSSLLQIQDLSSPTPSEAVGSIHFSASKHTLREGPWDGVGHLSGLIGGIFVPLALVGPPDLKLCLKVSNQPTSWCSTEPNSEFHNTQTNCHNSYSCDWWYPSGMSEPLLAAIVDEDSKFAGPWDFVGLVIIMPRGVREISPELAFSLREEGLDWAESLSPTGHAGSSYPFAIGERKRRMTSIEFLAQDANLEITLPNGFFSLLTE